MGGLKRLLKRVRCRRTRRLPTGSCAQSNVIPFGEKLGCSLSPRRQRPQPSATPLLGSASEAPSRHSSIRDSEATFRGGQSVTRLLRRHLPHISAPRSTRDHTGAAHTQPLARLRKAQPPTARLSAAQAQTARAAARRRRGGRFRDLSAAPLWASVLRPRPPEPVRVD